MWPLALATMAGLSTSVGAIVAVRVAPAHIIHDSSTAECRSALPQFYGRRTAAKSCLLLLDLRLAPPVISPQNCAQVVRRPSAQAMAALLGLALGVMACVSIVELVVRNAMSGGWVRRGG